MTKDIRSVAIFSAYYPPHLGGVELFSKNLAKALLQRGIDVTVVTSSLSCKTGGQQAEGPSKPKVLTLPSISLMGDRFPLIIPSRGFFALRKQLKDAAFDGIVVNTRYYPISLLACAEANRRGIRAILIDHSSGPISAEHTPLGSAMRGYERFMTRAIEAKNPLFCSVSRRGLEWLKSLGLHTAEVIPNSIDASAYRQMASKKNWRTALGLSKDDFLITYAGRLIPEKGLPKLIEAVKILHEANSNIALAIAGDGPLADGLHQQTGTYIKYVGRLDQADLSSLLSTTDCFCLPTEYPEGLPTVLLEAAAQECVIVVSDCAGAREVIPESSMGVVLEEVSPQSIASAMLPLVSNKTITQSMGACACAHVESAFSWNATAEKLLKTMGESTDGL